MRHHAVGILVKDRWELTQQTLESIYYSAQPKLTYDVYVIDNGSNAETKAKLKGYVKSGLVPIKNLIHIPQASISVAWNLFFMVTADYPYRTKMDNDLVLHNTLQKPPEKLPPNANTPAKADPLAGAPRSIGVIRGIGQHRKKKTFTDADIKHHTAFLQHLEEFGTENKVGMVALVSVHPSSNFIDTFQILVRKVHKKRAYLQSACIQFSKEAFDALGYLDERFLRSCFREYSQRAMRAKVNIGYHPYYGVIHAGASEPSLFPAFPPDKIQAEKEAEAGLDLPSLVQEPNFRVETAWLKYRDQIVQECLLHKIVTVG
jgi:glycosyltransferase involved in cell wall biosynthesis